MQAVPLLYTSPAVGYFCRVGAVLGGVRNGRGCRALLWAAGDRCGSLTNAEAAAKQQRVDVGMYMWL
jgi:hypothetical protein